MSSYSGIVRYCPCCDAYTAWRGIGNCDVCESESKPGKSVYHSTYMINKVYVFKVRFAGSTWPVSYSEEASDRVHYKRAHGKRRARLLKAMEAEVKRGVFDPSMWALTFPRRATELVVCKERAAAALSDKLPAVLGDIVLAYMW